MPINWRRDPFTGEDLAVSRTDRHTVPANSPYYVKLREVPKAGSLVVRGAGSQADQIGLEDAYVYEGNPTTNYGSSGILVTGRDGVAPNFYRHRSLAKFDLSAYTGPVDSAKLRIYNQTISSAGFPNANAIGAHLVQSAWSASSVTWDTAPAHDPVAAATATLYGEGWYELDITPLVNQWLAGTAPNHGVLLKHTNEISDTDSARNLSSLEAPDGNDPSLRLVMPGADYQEVAVSAPPAPGEFACAYDTAWLNFHSSAAGETVEVTMEGTGSPVDADDAGDLVKLIGNGEDGSLLVLTGTTTLDPGIYSYAALRVAPGAVLACSGGGPLIIGVTGDASLEGTVELDGRGFGGGAGGGTGGWDGQQGRGGAQGGAGGRGTNTPSATGGGGGGGGHQAAGSDGAAGSTGAPGGPGGEPSTSRDGLLWRWQPPSPGGGGGGGGGRTAASGGAGGAGGGSLLLQVRGHLRIPTGAVLRARGVAGGSPDGGGGSGGAFWLRATSREIAVTPEVTGGAGNGSGGAGAAGWWVEEGL